MDSMYDEKILPDMESKSSEETKTNKTSWWKRYQWRMRHYFYIHVVIFIFNGLFGGLVVFIIEKYIVPNRYISIRFIDTWFVAATCVYGCGLTTLDFVRLSTYSQVILMIFTLASGVTVSTLPALVIKSRTHKRERGLRVDDDHSAYHIPAVVQKNIDYSNAAQAKIARLPNAEQLRYWAYLSCLALIPITCITIYVIAFVCIGGWIQTHYRPSQLRQDGQPVNPWYASFIITVTGFNQNGVTPWSDNFMRFVDDTALNIFVILLVMSGNAFFPVIFRNVIMFIRWLVPWHKKVIFDYILLNNHRLSTVLYPTIQTRIYLTVTFLLYCLGVTVSLILDYNSQSFSGYSAGQRILIFVFHTVSARFAGFQTVDITLFAEGTLIIYILLMVVKPQMLCALDETPFELEWQKIRDKQTVFVETKHRRRLSLSSIDDSSIYPIRYLQHMLRDHSLDARLRAERYFSSKEKIHRSLSRTRETSRIKLRFFIFLMARRLLTHSLKFLRRSRTWLFIFIFLICAFENFHMTPIDENVTVLRILFEVISAFGAVGLTTGYPNLKSSFSTVFSVPSKMIIILTMLIGRHRGLLNSMKDQEEIEYSAQTLLERWERIAKDEHPLDSTVQSSVPPQTKPRNLAINRQSRTRYIVERPKPHTPPRTKRSVH